MRLEVFITELLYDHDCVIVPGFGGLVANYRSARLNKVSHMIKPPSKHVGFNRHLTHNDGLLANHISVIMNISFKEAMDMIEETVAEYLSALNRNERVVWERIGVIFKDRSGALQFIPGEQENFLLDAYGFEPIQLRSVAVSLPQPEPMIDIPAEVAVAATAPVVSTSPSWWKVAAAIAIPIAIAGTIFVAQGVAKNKFSVAALNPMEWGNHAADFSARVLNQPNFEESVLSSAWDSISESTNQEVVYYDFVNDQLSQQGIAVRVSTSTEAIVEPVVRHTDHTTKGKFVVVGGAFMIEENAEKLISELKTKGVEAFLAGKHKGLHIVALGSFASRSEADSARSSMRQSMNIPAWILAR